MNLDMEGKVVLVTGSSRGIGLGIVKTLLEEGCKVIINGKDEEKLNQAKLDLENEQTDNILAIGGDVNEIETINKVIVNTFEKWGHLDGVVANVGAVKNIHEWNISEEDWNWYFTNNFSVTHNTLQPLVPLLAKSQGSIVTIGSIAGLEDVGAPISYASSKAALMAYTKSLSRRLADKKIRVNLISPGNIHFPGGSWDKKLQSNPIKVQKILQEKVPLKKFGSPEDIGNVVAFLLSRRANFITGANFVVDGGQTITMI